MGADTKIEWATDTFNPWIGCAKVSPGCKNCYAEQLMDKRWGKVRWGPGQPRQRTTEKNWAQVRAWNRAAERAGKPRRVFCASLADWLDPEVDPLWLAGLMGLIAETPHLIWMLLTKRPHLFGTQLNEAYERLGRNDDYPAVNLIAEWTEYQNPPANVWVGTTVEDQERADERIPALLEIPARVRFLSCEPLLGAVNLIRLLRDHAHNPVAATGHCMTCGGAEVERQHHGPDWVICGGESGPGARPMHPSWVRSLRDQCQAAGVAYFFKQWGEWRPKLSRIAGEPQPTAKGSGWGTLDADGRWWPTTTPWNGRQDEDSEEREVVMVRTGKDHAGRQLDGRTWDELPQVAP